MTNVLLLLTVTAMVFGANSAASFQFTKVDVGKKLFETADVVKKCEEARGFVRDLGLQQIIYATTPTLSYDTIVFGTADGNPVLVSRINCFK